MNRKKLRAGVWRDTQDEIFQANLVIEGGRTAW